MLKHSVVPVLPPSLELAVHEDQLLRIVAGLGINGHGDVGGVYEELVGCDREQTF